MSREFWNERYDNHVSVYGNQPNQFLREQLENLKPGRILFPAEGEGRNAIYAAAKGWEVHAFDYSEVAVKKALANANSAGVSLTCTVDEIGDFDPGDSVYDAIALIYIHLPETIRRNFHHQCMQALKPGGVIILEAFSLDQLAYSSGGPRNGELLYTPETLLQDFGGVEILSFESRVVTLDEGTFHNGAAAVLRLVVRKNV